MLYERLNLGTIRLIRDKRVVTKYFLLLLTIHAGARKSVIYTFVLYIRQRQNPITLFAIHLYNLIIFLDSRSHAFTEANRIYSFIFFLSLFFLFFFFSFFFFYIVYIPAKRYHVTSKNRSYRYT